MPRIKIRKLKFGHEDSVAGEPCKMDIRGSASDLELRYKVEGENPVTVRTENPPPPPPPSPEPGLPEDQDPVKILMNHHWQPAGAAADGGPTSFAFRGALEWFSLRYTGWFFCYCETQDGVRCQVKKFRLVAEYDGENHPTAAVLVSPVADCSDLANLVLGPELLPPGQSGGTGTMWIRFPLDLPCPCAPEPSGKGEADGAECRTSVLINYRFEAA